MSAFQYDAFISYRRSDGSRIAGWLRRELQQFRPPRRLSARLDRPFRVYLDTAYERGSIDFYQRTIQPALMASRHLIVLATPDAVQRAGHAEDWIRREIDDFTAGQYAENVIVVRAAGEFDGPLPANLAERFPNVQIVDLRGAGRVWYLNPLRAPRFAAEKLKIIAPMLDLAPDEMPVLRQEEERKQQTRLGNLAGAATDHIDAYSGTLCGSPDGQATTVTTSVLSTGRHQTDSGTATTLP